MRKTAPKPAGGGTSHFRTIKQPRTLRELKELLRVHGVNYSSWGQGEIKSPRALFQEILEGSTTLSNEDGVLTRKVQSVGIVITREDGWFLIEHERIFDGGIRHGRGRGVSVAEKIRTGESAIVAAVRGIKEELRIQIPLSQLIGDGRQVQDRKSSSFPGLATKVIESRFRTCLINGQVREEYQEVLPARKGRPARTTIFRWAPSLTTT